MKRKLKYRKLELKTFFWWMTERHSIWQQRYDKKPPPWTKDKILSRFKFTNVYRQLDRVTEAWTDRFVKILGRGKDMTDGDLFFHCVMFRLFNWPETYDALYYTMPHQGLYSRRAAIRALKKRFEEGKKIFTGAYIVSNGGSDDRKYLVYAKALVKVFKRRDELAKAIRKSKSMERSVELVSELPLVGRFVAYEIACDLRHTRLLSGAHDLVSWANPGPGAKRGISRLLTGKKNALPKFRTKDYVDVMRDLYRIAPQHFKGKCEWPFELREIEHSLCEFDKYMRVKKGEGRPRSTFTPQKTLEETPEDRFYFVEERADKVRAQIKRERAERRKKPEKWSRYYPKKEAA